MAKAPASKSDRLEGWGKMYRAGGGNITSEEYEKHGQSKAERVPKSGKIANTELGRHDGGNVAEGKGEKHDSASMKGSSQKAKSSVTIGGAVRGEGGNCPGNQGHEESAKGSARAMGGKRSKV